MPVHKGVSENDIAAKVKHFKFSASVRRPIRRAPLFAAFSSMNGENEIVINRPTEDTASFAEKNIGTSVLLVDDNAVNQQVAAAILHKQGFLVDIANDGLQALMLFKANHYSVVLMDFQMPVMDGF